MRKMILAIIIQQYAQFEGNFVGNTAVNMEKFGNFKYKTKIIIIIIITILIKNMIL